MNTKSNFETKFININQEIPLQMDILDKWLTYKHESQPLKGVTALFIQHQFGNQVPQAKAMIELGLNPDNLFWIDIPYSSNARVRNRLMDLGIPNNNFVTCHDYRVLDVYSSYQRRRVQEKVKDFISNPPDKLLVLDDGGYFLEAASCFIKRIPNVSIVEQTTRGVIKIENNAAMRQYSRVVPVINVAESIPKKRLEPPFIALSVSAKLGNILDNNFSSKLIRNCLILGLGSIGAKVTQFISEFLDVNPERIHIYDTDTKKMEPFLKKGYSPWIKEDFSTKFGLVIGCSGTSSFSVYDYVYLEDGALLASASSGTVELSRKEFIELADSSEFDNIHISRNNLHEWNTHSNINIQLVDRHVTFLNAGFPINFDGRSNNVPTEYMQPTATMMVSAAIQSLSTKSTNLIDLDIEFCKWLDKEFQEYLGEKEYKVFFPNP